MTIGEKLTESKNGLEALLSYANETTEHNDTNIGDAIKTLSDSYPSDGLGFKFIKSVTIDESWQNDTKGNPVAISNALIGVAEPKAIYFIIAKNNTDSSNYKFRWLFATSEKTLFENGTTNGGGLLLRGHATLYYREFNTSVSSWASVGTTFHVYKMHIANN